MSFITFLQNKLGLFKGNSPKEGVNSAVAQDLSSLTVVKLKAMAKNKGLTGYSRLNKASLVELLEKCQ